MDFGHLKLLVALVFVECVWSLPLGCQDNGTSYREGEVVQAGGPCLSCVCRRGALACSLRVCADYVEALPPGCFLVHEPNDCCPRLFCEGGFNPGGIDLRTAVKTEESKVDENGCMVNGTVYGEGSAVASWDPCEYCYCTEGDIKCVKPRCVQSFEGCKAVYERFSCCPTHFDCRDAKVGFLTSRVKHLGSLNSNAQKNPSRSLAGIDSKSQKGDFAANQSDQSPTLSEEKTTEDFAVATTEEVSTEESVPERQPESTTPSSFDYLTTLRLQTPETENSGKESSTVGLLEETTPAVITYALPKTGERGEEASGAGSGNPMDVGEVVESRWNSSEVAEDYDAYDYGEPKLPPSLPNLVIFPFVAADAVVKDDRAELREAIQVKKMEDQAVNFKDYFSPPTKTEGRSNCIGGEVPKRKQIPSFREILSGGFVPKHPSPEPFYEFPFQRKELTEQPAESPAEGKQTAPQIKTPPHTHNKVGSSFGDNQRTKLATEDISSGSLRRSPVPPGAFSQMRQTEMAEFLLRENSESFRKSQQTKQPVTVTYKNLVVDFYPDYLVTTTRTHSATQSEACLNDTDKSNQLQQRNPTTSVSLNMFPDLVFGFSNGATIMAPPKAAQELPTEETRPSVAEVAPTVKVLPTSITEESSFFEQFLKSLTESNTPTVITFTTNNKHKYSSKIKGRISTTAKPKREDGAASGQLKGATSSTPIASRPFSSMVTSSEGPSTTFHSTDSPQSPREGPGHSFTTLPPILPETESLASPELVGVRGHHIESRPQDGPDRDSSRIHSNPGTLLKLAGCNIYGMMYRIGKVITELSGPCAECLCTDLGVQCNPLEC